jgi:hypothetical protein
MLAIVNESQGNKVEKLLAVPGIQLATVNKQVVS